MKINEIYKLKKGTNSDLKNGFNKWKLQRKFDGKWLF